MALERWEKTWQMTFHPAKCSVIRISTNGRQIINTSYQIQGHTLEIVDSSKYTGVTIMMTWLGRNILKTLLPRLTRHDRFCSAKYQRVYIPSEVCCLYNHGTSKTPVLLYSLGSSPDKQCPRPGTRSATSSLIRPSELNPVYPRICDTHGSEAWVRVPPATTLHGQNTNAL